MSAAQIREKLHELIDKADDDLLRFALEIFEERSEGLLSNEQRMDLNKRIERHKSGESASYSWDEVRKKIEEKRI